MSNGTIIQQGKFTADGNTKIIQLRSNVDWFEVDNATTSAAGGAGTGVEFKWYRGMATDTGIEYQKLAADDSLKKVVLANGGFTLIDTSESPLSALNATGTGITGATGIATCTSTAGLVDGDTVRLINPVGAQQFGGVDFTITGVVANTQFDLVYSPIIANSTTFSFYKIKWPPLFYPTYRYITSISQAAQAVIIMTVTHYYTVGERVRINVPSEFGMTEINGMTGVITAINSVPNSITVDIDSSAFTAFAWPTTADVPFTHATVHPIGEGTAQTLAGTFDAAQKNIGYIGMQLAAGVDSPAGAANDVIYWRAGKSLNVDIE